MYDDRLVRAAQQGDQAAFAALYDRAADSVYDLCWSLTGDAAEAARLVETAFLLAAGNLDQLTDPSQVRPWLLAIAGDQALADEAEGTLESGWERQQGRPGDDEPLGNLELRRWVGDATAVLALADQLVLELQLRCDLNDDQLAAAVGCPVSGLADVLARVDAEATKVLGSLVLARQGRTKCPQLAELLEGWDGSPGIDIADAVDAHAGTCTRCARRRRAQNPLDLVSEAPLVAAPAALRTPILDAVAAELGSTSPRAGPPVRLRDDDEPRIPTAALAGAGAVLLVLIVAVVIALSLGGSKKTGATAPGGAPATTIAAGPAPTIAPFDTTTSTTAPPGSVLSLNTSVVNLGRAATTAQVVLSNTAATPANWTASTVVPWITITPASGYLTAGQSVRVTFTIDRASAPSGPFDTRVLFAGADQGGRSASVELTGTNTTTTTTSPPETTTSTPSTTSTTAPKPPVTL